MQKVIFCFLFFYTFTGFSQATEFKWAWNENKPLTWADFQAEPGERERYDASTNSGISYSWSFSTHNGKEQFCYEVRSNFYPNLSWVKNGENNEHLLAHEQLHFDISELHARKLRKAIKEYRITSNIKQDLRDIYYQIETERQEMQNKFDLESRHSTEKEAEGKWQNHVKTELDKYGAYAF